ncbi:MAG: NADAR family protein [Brevundimonas sp.]|uniref:NADAR family protein n=1 Tax=Brevundimonas sp. TaxID=1871086 RepID=UPI00262DF702|nr:NADAR family protein [Brevundimonas sp.]MDI6624509.1 NADAR family protein [Brevundimonas sp.]
MSLAHYDVDSGSRERRYERRDAVVFLKTKEAFGGLSNMAGGYPLRINGIRIATAEALYQACRFPDRPDVQRTILAEASPMTAKMRGKPFREFTRDDWDIVRVPIMRWSLRAKLAFHYREFSDLLKATGNRAIVEQSRRDGFWGAVPADDDSLVGMNVLGRLLMELREEISERDEESFRSLAPLNIPNFVLDGRPIETVITRRSTLF